MSTFIIVAAVIGAIGGGRLIKWSRTPFLNDKTKGDR